jgi:hypothetical protein
MLLRWGNRGGTNGNALGSFHRDRGLLLSVSCGLLLEEMLFGGLVRLFFARRPESREDKERKLKGESAHACAKKSALRRGSAIVGYRSVMTGMKFVTVDSWG